MINFDINKLETPYFVVDEALIKGNLEVLADVKRQTGCKILLAQKAFSMFATYPLISQYLDGTCASGLHEALLAHEHFDGENHIFSPAYTEKDMAEILRICDHLVFNSFSQWERFRHLTTGKTCGIRINPEFSTQDTAIYDPCSPMSRLGVTRANFRPDLLEGISGLHFHALCQQGAEELADTFKAAEEKFGELFYQMDWLNFGGGHHITRESYNIRLLVDTIKHAKQKYGVEVYLEPGEAIALDAGFLVAQVVDIIDNGGKIDGLF